MSHSREYLQQVAQIASDINPNQLEQMVEALVKLRENNGRLFFLGVGGGAGNCTHAVNDFRKLCGIEAYSPCDNVSELTARTNDEGWESVFSAWLTTSKISDKDAVFVFSVGGGNQEQNISPNIVSALKLAKERGALIFGVVGRDGGYTQKVGDHVIVVPTVDPEAVTAHTESYQTVLWHGLVSHPALLTSEFKWEQVINEGK